MKSNTSDRKSIQFRLTPESPRALGYLRIGVACVLLLKFVREAAGLWIFYGAHGILPWALSEVALTPWTPRLSWVTAALGRLHVSPDTSVEVVIALYALFLVGLLLGWKSRLMASGAWFSHLILFNSSGLTNYGLDYFANIALFYCMITPVGDSLCLDVRRRPERARPSLDVALYLLLIRAHLALAYFNSGFQKARGPQWWNGEAVWRAVMQPQFHVLPMAWLASVPWLARVFTVGTVGVEIGYLFFIWPRETRRFWVLATVGMHLGIGVVLGLWSFSLLLIVLNISVFGSDILDGVLAAVRRKRPRSQPTATPQPVLSSR